jgi:competence transcription factor ComK
MNYIKRSNVGVLVSCKGEQKELNIGFKAYINQLCHHRLASYDGILKTTKKMLDIYKLVPIYVSRDILLFPLSSIRNMDTIFINYYELYQIKKNVGSGLSLLFSDQTKLNIDMNKMFLSRQIGRCERIIQFLNKKSQESVYNYTLSIEI